MPRFRDEFIFDPDVVWKMSGELLATSIELDKAKARVAELEAAGQDALRPKRPRKPNVGKIIEQVAKATEKTGKPVTSVTMPDGTKLDFSKPPDATADDEVENWL